MKTTTEELIALQDDPSFDPERRAELQADAGVRLQLGLLRQRRQALRELPELQPPPGSWQRIVAVSAATRRGFSRRTVTGLATAAAAALVAVVVISFGFPDRSQPGPQARVAQDFPATPDIEALRQRSRQLEQVLRSMPRGPVVRRVDTAGAIVELQDQIAVVDYRLNRAGDAGISPQDASTLWRQRVELMDRLLRARYAETEGNTF